MPTLTITTKGQITLKQELLRHMKIGPGDKIQAEKLPDGGIMVRAAKPTGSIEDFSGCLAGKTNIKLTIEEINDAIADAWAGRR